MKKLLLLISLYAVGMYAMDEKGVSDFLARAKTLSEAGEKVDFDYLMNAALYYDRNPKLAFTALEFVASKSNQKNIALIRLHGILMGSISEKDPEYLKYKNRFDRVLRCAYDPDFGTLHAYLTEGGFDEENSYLILLRQALPNLHYRSHPNPAAASLARVYKKDTTIFERLRRVIDDAERLAQEESE